MRFVDADALKICIQDHYNVIEQDCSISEEFADGAMSGIDAAMFEIGVAPTVDAIPVEWLKELLTEPDARNYVECILSLWKWSKGQEDSK